MLAYTAGAAFTGLFAQIKFKPSTVPVSVSGSGGRPHSCLRRGSIEGPRAFVVRQCTNRSPRAPGVQRPPRGGAFPDALDRDVGGGNEDGEMMRGLAKSGSRNRRPRAVPLANDETSYHEAVWRLSRVAAGFADSGGVGKDCAMRLYGCQRGVKAEQRWRVRAAKSGADERTQQFAASPRRRAQRIRGHRIECRACDRVR